MDGRAGGREGRSEASRGYRDRRIHHQREPVHAAAAAAAAAGLGRGGEAAADLLAEGGRGGGGAEADAAGGGAVAQGEVRLQDQVLPAREPELRLRHQRHVPQAAGDVGGAGGRGTGRRPGGRLGRAGLGRAGVGAGRGWDARPKGSLPHRRLRRGRSSQYLLFLRWWRMRSALMLPMLQKRNRHQMYAVFSTRQKLLHQEPGPTHTLWLRWRIRISWRVFAHGNDGTHCNHIDRHGSCTHALSIAFLALLSFQVYHAVIPHYSGSFCKRTTVYASASRRLSFLEFDTR